jgi:GT2 family glycosyltransferase
MSMGIVVNTCIPESLLHPRFDYLQRTLDEVLRQMHENDPLVVVDDCSCDEVREYLRMIDGDYPQFQAIYRDLPPNFEGPFPWRLASSRNMGVEALGEQQAFIFLDADCLPVEEWLQAYRNELERFQLMPLGIVIFGRTDHQLLNDQIQVDLRVELTGEARPRREASLFERGGGGNMLISRETFAALKGFDEAYDGGFGYEETDFAVRAYHAGAEVLYCETAQVLHLYHRRDKEHFHGLDRNRRIFQARTRLFAGGRG